MQTAGFWIILMSSSMVAICAGTYWLKNGWSSHSGSFNLSQETTTTCKLNSTHNSFLAAEGLCHVGLPQNVSKDSCCHNLRQQEVLKNQLAYRLVTKGDIPFALVDLTGEQLQRIIALEPFTRSYALSFKNMTKSVTKVLKDYVKKELEPSKKHTGFLMKLLELAEKALGIKDHVDEIMSLFGALEGFAEFLSELQSYEEFAKIRDFFIDGLEKQGMSYPSRSEAFQAINPDLMSDEYFAQQRLAGANPMTLQSVRTKGGAGGVDWFDLRRTLNPKIKDLDKELGDNDKMYVLRYPLCDELPRQLDITNINFTRKMETTRSPIALFVSDSKMKGELRPIAIQMDNTPDSAAYTPKDSCEDWMVAKLNVQTTDAVYGQIVEHLVKVHFVSEVFCVAMRRHLPDLHPLQQIMKFHCREVMVPNVLGTPLLLNPITGFTSLLFGTGNKGAKVLINRAYHETTWNITDFWGNIQDRGLEHEPAYFPYRDDGKVIYDTVETMVVEYVAKYYTSEGDIANDAELQAFANEVSADGRRPPDGGDGKIRGFPTTITTREQLQEILTRIIFHVTVQHASVNYELNDYVAFVPNMPFKSYKRTNSNDLSFGVLPNKATATIQVVLTMVLSSLRYDKLFDYGDQLSDPQGREIVNRHFNLLSTVVAKNLKLTNAKRKAAGQLTYPYLLPEWLPNGVQT